MLSAEWVPGSSPGSVPLSFLFCFTVYTGYTVQPEVLIIQRPDVDFPAYLAVAMKVLGHSPASAADASSHRLTTASRFLSCLAAMKDTKAEVSLNPKLLAHVMYSVLIVADEPDVLDIMECAGGMPFVTTETIARGVLLTIMSGSLAQWKHAVVAGSTPEMSPGVRYAFNQIQKQFQSESINLWMDYRQRQAADNVTFLLDDKRGR